MGKQLLVYFSRSGNTRIIAEAIAAICSADIERIEEARSRSGIFGYFRSAREALGQRIVEIRPPGKNAADYDVVILGTPVWAGNLSSPMRAYLIAQRGRLNRVAFFCTQGGSGAENVFQQMAELCQQAPLARLAVNVRDIRRRQYSEKLQNFRTTLESSQGAA
jgi:flavodoxin